MLKMSKSQREEAERVIAATADVNLGAGLWCRPPRSRRDGAPLLILRYSAPDGRRRELGLGALKRASVQQVADRLELARREVASARALLRDGKDPLEVRNAERDRARHVTDRHIGATRRELEGGSDRAALLSL